MSISNALVHHIRNSSLLSQFHAKVSKIGWNLDAGDTNQTCIGRDTVCCCYLLESSRAWNRHSETVALIVDFEGKMRVWKLLVSIFLCFSFSMLLFLSAFFSYNHLNHSYWLLFVFCYNCPTPFYWIGNFN